MTEAEADSWFDRYAALVIRLAGESSSDAEPKRDVTRG
jgi:hypothetical protein